MSDSFQPFAAVVVADRSPIDIEAITVQRFLAKITIDGEHHVWTGGLSNGTPVMSFALNTVRAANFAWVVAHRADVPPKQLAAPTCGNALCLRPDHLGLRTRVIQPRPQRSMTIEEIAPPALARLGEAQFGIRAPRQRFSAVQIVALITTHQIAVVPFKSGGVKAFTPGGSIVHGDDLPDAIEKIMRALEAA